MSVWAGDAEECAFEHSREQRARVDHECDACGEPILPGHRYVTQVFGGDGAPQQFKRCLRCERIYRHLTARMVGTDEFCHARGHRGAGVLVAEGRLTGGARPCIHCDVAPGG